MDFFIRSYINNYIVDLNYLRIENMNIRAATLMKKTKRINNFKCIKKITKIALV